MNELSRRQQEYLIQALDSGDLTEEQALQFTARNKVVSGTDYNRTLVSTGLVAALAFVVVGATGGMLAGAIVLAMGLETYFKQRQNTKSKLKLIDDGHYRDQFEDEPEMLQLIDELKPLPPTEQLANGAAASEVIDVPAVRASPVTSPTAAQGAAAKKTGSAIGAVNRLKAMGVGSHSAIDVIDIATAIGENLKPLIITAKPRTGKGIVVAHGWRAAKAANPDLTIWLIQPKPHPKESGYWAGVDRYWGCMVEDHPINDEAIAAELSQFILEWRKQRQRPTLLIVDELVKLEAQLPKWYRETIPALMKVESSSGETDKRFLWAITQSPLVKDLGLTTGNRSAFDFLTIEKADTLDHAIAVQQSVASLQSVPASDDFRASPVGILGYYSGFNSWFAVPRYLVPQPTPTVAHPQSPLQRTDLASVAPVIDAVDEPRSLYDELAADFDATNELPLMGDFILWLKTKRNQVITRRNIIQLWGNKKDRRMTSNELVQPLIDEAIALGLLRETEDGFRAIDT